MTSSPVTMAEIARVAGVSRVTVSNILNGRTRGAWNRSAREVERIKMLAKEMGYRPHAAAKATASGRFGSVALLTRWDINAPHLSVSKGFASTLGKHGILTNYGIVPKNALHDPDAAPRLLRELCVDGLAVNFDVEIEPELVEMVQKAGVPTIWINTRQDADCVRPNDYAAGATAAKTLVEAGHRQLGYLVDHDTWQPRPHYSIADRLAGFADVAAPAGAAVMRVVAPRRTQELASLDEWRATLHRHRDMTAWICRGSEIGAVMMAALSMGLQVPRDLSLITFDSGGTKVGVPVSQLGIPMFAVGEKAAELLLQKIEDPTERLPCVTVPFRDPGLETIAPPPKA